MGATQSRKDLLLDFRSVATKGVAPQDENTNSKLGKALANMAFHLKKSNAKVQRKLEWKLLRLAKSHSVSHRMVEILKLHHSLESFLHQPLNVLRRTFVNILALLSRKQLLQPYACEHKPPIGKIIFDFACDFGTVAQYQATFRHLQVMNKQVKAFKALNDLQPGPGPIPRSRQTRWASLDCNAYHITPK